MSDDEKKTGYGNPPKATRFKKGQSGNPKGRPKGHKNFKTDLTEALSATIPITIDGKKKSVTKQRAIIESVILKALQGSDRARAQLFSMIVRSLAEENARETTTDFSEQDLEILRRYEARLTERLKSQLPNDEKESRDE